MIDLVLFDADGVIQTTSAEWLPALKSLAPSDAQADQLLADIFTAEKRCISGQEAFAEALVPVLAKWGIQQPAQQVLDIWTLIDPVHDNLNVVSTLRDKGYATGLATNQQEHRANYIRQHLGYLNYFDHLFISCEMGVAKPSQDYFHQIAKNMSLPVASMVFIDDHPDNVEAARSAGVAAEVYDLDSGMAGLLDVLATLGVDKKRV